MSIGGMQAFFDEGLMYMHLKCIRCKITNKVCVNTLLAKKSPPLCGKCKKNLIEQEDVNEIADSINVSELTPQVDPVWKGVEPYEGVDDEEGDDWIV